MTQEARTGLFMLAIYFSAMFIATITFGGCTQTTVTPPEVPSPTVTWPKLSWDGKVSVSDAAKWRDAVAGSVKASKLMKASLSDASTFSCPKYSSMNDAQKPVFWTALIAEKTKWESNFNTNSVTPECRKASCVYEGGCQYVPQYGYCMKGGHKLDGGVVISRGLAQMSLQSAQGLGCDFKTPKELHDPVRNLLCVVKGLERYVGNDNRIAGIGSGNWKGAARYWAVFRGTNDYTKQSLSALKLVGKAVPGCL